MKPLKSTTAMVMCLSLTLPGPLLAQAQGNGNARGATELCGDSPNPPCMTEAGNMLLPGKGRAKELEMCVGEDALPCRTEDGFMLVDASSDEALEMMLEEDLANEAAESGEPAAGGESVDAGVAVESGAAVEAEDMTAEAENDVAVESETETPVLEAETETVEATEAETAESGAVSTIEQDTTAETEIPPAATEAEAMTEAEMAAEAEVEATESETMVEPETTAETETMAEPETTAETETMAETETEMAAEAETTADVEVIENPEITQEVQEGIVEVEDAGVSAAASAAEATADGEVAEGVEVEEEAVTEETARSSSEDFDTNATVTESASATTSGGRDGMSKFEKALLLGLGAVAVGAILNNGDQVVSNSGDRVVVKSDDGNLRVLKDDDALLRQPGSQVRTETFADGSTRTTVIREDGSRVVTIRASDGRVVRRARVFADGSQVVLFDDSEAFEPVDVSTLPDISTRPSARLVDNSDEDALRAALAAELRGDTNRSFSLRQVRQIRKVRELAPEVELDAVTFASGSAAIQPTQAEELAAVGRAMARAIEDSPGEVFLIEGHTDAVGDASYNLALSDRRAETVALALSEYFDVPPENMITQGYGESYLKIQSLGNERANRRATVRRITPLLRQVASNN